MNRFDALVAAGIPSLSAAEMAELEGLIAQIAVEDSDDTDPATLDRLVAAADAAEALRAEAQARAVKADAARQRVRGESGETVTAAAPPKRVPLRDVRQTPRPDRDAPVTGPEHGVRASLVASADVGDPGEVSDLNRVAELFNSKIRHVAGIRSGEGGQHVVLQSRWKQPYSVSGNDPEKNAAALTAAATALTASGGICGPAGVDYAVPVWANVARPVRDALPAVEAPRGALTYTVPPVYSLATYGAGVSIWTEANDRNPGAAGTGAGGTGTGPVTKPVLTIDCDQTVTTTVEAITQAIQIGNFRGRFSPEGVQAALTYLEQAWASTAESELLRQMRAAAKHVSYTAQFGIARDALVALDRITAYVRDRYRLSDSVVLRVVMKSWVKNAIRADLAKAAFPMATGDPSVISLAVTDAQIAAWFAVRNVVPVWTLDDDTNDQSFAVQGAGTPGSPVALVGYPATTRMLVYPEGTYQFLDGGELNLGVVRDSALNAVNQYQVFAETFEAVAFRGFEAIDFKASFVVNGASAGTSTPA